MHTRFGIQVEDVRQLEEDERFLYSQADQDLFALGMNNYKRFGTYVDIGCSFPRQSNNTFLLEKFGWKGISIDIRAFEKHWHKHRINKFTGVDATRVDFRKLFSEEFPDVLEIDYLSYDVDEASNLVLPLLPFDEYSFRVITIEHDLYRTSLYKEFQHNFLKKLGYICIAEDVLVPLENECPFEDWWISPNCANEAFQEYNEIAAMTNNKPHEIINKLNIYGNRKLLVKGVASIDYVWNPKPQKTSNYSCQEKSNSSRLVADVFSREPELKSSSQSISEKTTPTAPTKFNFSHRTNEYATHQPVLCEIVNRTRGSVIEFGCGYGSTELLHCLCRDDERKLITLDNDPKWLDSFRSRFESNWHKFILVDDWYAILQNPQINRNWDVVFVDQSPWEARVQTIRILRNKAQYVILHDCNCFPDNGFFGKSFCRLRSSNDRGIRTYGDVFQYFKEFFPLDPWPCKEYGPPTLLASNFNPVDIIVDYERY